MDDILVDLQQINILYLYVRYKQIYRKIAAIENEGSFVVPIYYYCLYVNVVYTHKQYDIVNKIHQFYIKLVVGYLVRKLISSK